MKKNRTGRNIKVIAENCSFRNGFNIYLVFSGHREYLMFHRYNGLLYGLLKDGVNVDDVRRWKPAYIRYNRNGKARDTKLNEMVKHLIAVIDDYMDEREAC